MKAYFEKTLKRKESKQFMLLPNIVTIRAKSDVSILPRLRLNLTSVQNVHVRP